jgi:hypothetical protein
VRQLQKPAVCSERKHGLRFGQRLREPKLAVASFKVLNSGRRHTVQRTPYNRVLGGLSERGVQGA